MTVEGRRYTGIGGAGRRSFGGDGPTAAFLTAVAGLVLVGFFAVAAAGGPDVWVPVLVVAVLAAISVPICSATAGRPIDPRLRRILLVAFALKMACAFPRYAMNEVAYDGAADAGMYHEAGQTFRENGGRGNWSFDGAFIERFPDETRSVGYVVGALYVVTGASQMTGYLVFSWISWLGLVFVFRAFRLGFPNAPPYLAAGLIFFLPSTLYWPSSIGKDAVMVFAIGLVTLGISRLMSGERSLLGLAWMGIGGLAMLQIRPHLLLIALVGGAASMIATRPGLERTRHPLAVRLVLLAALVPALAFGLGRMDDVFGAPSDGDSFSVSGALDRTAQRSEVGGSAFETQPVSSPLDLPAASVNVVFRPFLFEARNLASLVTALEGTALLLGAVVGARWLWRAGPAMARSPLAAYCGAFTLAFVIAFSNVGNAGILARQRVQMFPLLLVVVAAAAEHRRLNATAVAADRNPDLDLTAISTLDPRLVSTP